jgi:hypothetical protein
MAKVENMVGTEARAGKDGSGSVDHQHLLMAPGEKRPHRSDDAGKLTAGPRKGNTTERGGTRRIIGRKVNVTDNSGRTDSTTKVDDRNKNAKSAPETSARVQGPPGG